MNISPLEIEACILTHPLVLDVAVLGVPDPEMGQRLVAVVAPTVDALADEELASDILNRCREQLAGYKIPRSVAFVDDLPRSAVGKLNKARVAASLARDR